MRPGLSWKTAACFAALLLLGVGTTAAAPLRGNVRLTGDAPEADTEDQFYWNAWNGLIDPVEPSLDPARELTVVLTGSTSGPPIGCNASIRGGDLFPRTVVGRIGQDARITNRDGCTHELMSAEIEEFTPISTAPGNTRPVHVPDAGPHPIEDRLYAHVSGHLVGLPDLVACAEITPRGAFQFADVNPGNYQLKIFRNGAVVHEQAIEMTDSSLTLENPIALTAGE